MRLLEAEREGAYKRRIGGRRPEADAVRLIGGGGASKEENGVVTEPAEERMKHLAAHPTAFRFRIDDGRRQARLPSTPV